MMPDTIPAFRSRVIRSDRDAVRRIVEETGFFRPDEVRVAIELVEEALMKGETAGYHFIFAEFASAVAGYACYGPIPCTLGSYDLYWIAVEPRRQGQGIGRQLLCEAERQIRQRGGRHIYIETSGRPQYASTRAFYKKCGYDVAAELTDFYDHDDHKIIWRKVWAVDAV